MEVDGGAVFAGIGEDAAKRGIALAETGMLRGTWEATRYLARGAGFAGVAATMGTMVSRLSKRATEEKAVCIKG